VIVSGFVTNCADSVADTSCFTAFDPLAITSGFVAGVNTLEFDVMNGDPGTAFDGPSGLRVQIVSAVAEATPVPEPGLFSCSAPASWPSPPAPVAARL
jgi:hypothetical protein